jgi:hypothetical protein
MGSDLGFLWSMLVGIGQGWWAFDGPKTAREHTLTAHRRPRNGPVASGVRWVAAGRLGIPELPGSRGE